jgi:hypothetical protein
MKLHPSYECRCSIPTPLMHLGEDTGLCHGCNGVYDASLYERRLRQHCDGIVGDDLDEILRAVDPNYAQLVA